MNGYLEGLDRLLALGAAGLSRRLADLQVGFVAAHQLTDGGFRGRQGGSDPYYTDFALRVLALLAPEHDAIPRAASDLESLTEPPRSVVECFTVLNIARLSGRDAGVRWQVVGDRWQAAGHGVLSDALGRRPVSPYDAFLAALCLEMLERDEPALDAAALAMAELRAPDGGFRGAPGEGPGQTNVTAAAVGLLQMREMLDEETAAAAAGFLAGMQAPDGGLRAHARAPGGDLLSTFTGVLTLFGLDAMDSLDVPAIARFARASASPGGGFRAAPDDEEPDVEYTYYGVGTVCLLRTFALLREQT